MLARINIRCNPNYQPVWLMIGMIQLIEYGEMLIVRLQFRDEFYPPP